MASQIDRTCMQSGDKLGSAFSKHKMITRHYCDFFFKTEAKDLPHPLIKKKFRVAFTTKSKEI